MDDSTSLWSLLTLIFIIVLHYYVSGKAARRNVGTFCAFLAALALSHGALILAREYGRSDRGRTTPGVITAMLNSSSDKPPRHNHGNRYANTRRLVSLLMIPDGFRFDDLISRLLLTGSLTALRVQYRFDCQTDGSCSQTDIVGQQLWAEAQIGRPVTVRFSQDLPDPGRLAENPQWPTGLAKVGIGGFLGIVAAILTGRLKVRRKFIVVPGVVMSVDPVTAGGAGWRVGFAYFSACGLACESASVVYVSGVKKGDHCVAEYPDGQPHLATLRLNETTTSAA